MFSVNLCLVLLCICCKSEFCVNLYLVYFCTLIYKYLYLILRFGVQTASMIQELMTFEKELDDSKFYAKVVIFYVF